MELARIEFALLLNVKDPEGSHFVGVADDPRAAEAIVKSLPVGSTPEDCRTCLAMERCQARVLAASVGRSARSPERPNGVYVNLELTPPEGGHQLGKDNCCRERNLPGAYDGLHEYGFVQATFFENNLEV